jgi:biotin carboxyl carrier protein
MKMEYAVSSPVDGVVSHIRIQQSDMVQQGMPLCLVEPVNA